MVASTSPWMTWLVGKKENKDRAECNRTTLSVISHDKTGVT